MIVDNLPCFLEIIHQTLQGMSCSQREAYLDQPYDDFYISHRPEWCYPSRKSSVRPSAFIVLGPSEMTILPGKAKALS